MKALGVQLGLNALVVAALLAAGIGCKPGRIENKPPPAVGGDADLASRLSAASAIGSSSERDTALAKVAVDAAQAGEGAIAKTALQQIGSTSVMDTAAADAARRLAAAGKGADAVAVAKSIGSSSVRDETLKAIATKE